MNAYSVQSHSLTTIYEQPAINTILTRRSHLHTVLPLMAANGNIVQGAVGTPVAGPRIVVGLDYGTTNTGMLIDLAGTHSACLVLR
jgi:hypothetical protein